MALQGIKMTVPAGEPAVAAPPVLPVAVGDDPGGADATDPPPSNYEREEEEAVFGEQEGDDLTDADISDEEDDDDTDDEDIDSDSEFEEDGRPMADPGDVLVATFGFLGRPTRFASVVSTAGFMRLATTRAAPDQDGGGGGGGEIVVQYRYTRFLSAQSGGGGVDMHVLGPKLARVRFHLPSHAISDPVSSLHLAGASLASLAIYPARFNAHLQTLWTGLVLMAPVRVPPRTTRLVVTVDVGILRPEDRTPERMRSMRAALESVARERDAHPPATFDVGTELHLPAPLVSEDDVRPTKRRRVTGEDCPICCEVLERGLAAWPRCSHIFHGRCLEQHLLRGHQECPMCRSELKVEASSRVNTSEQNQTTQCCNCEQVCKPVLAME